MPPSTLILGPIFSIVGAVFGILAIARFIEIIRRKTKIQKDVISLGNNLLAMAGCWALAFFFFYRSPGP